MDYKQKQNEAKYKSKKSTVIWPRGNGTYVKAVHGLIGSDKVRVEKRANELSKRRA